MSLSTSFLLLLAVPDTQVEQLIQAMTTFSAQNGGLTWDQAIDQRPDDVQAILAANWMPAS